MADDQLGDAGKALGIPERGGVDLDEVRERRRRFHSALIAVSNRLDTPYTDAPEWTPWTRYVRPAIASIDETLDALLADLDAARQERDSARATLSIVEENFREMERERDHLVLAVKARDIAVREADRLRAAAEAALENVRHLHQQYRGVPDFDICAGCSIGMEVRAWPCPTIAALDSTDPVEDAPAPQPVEPSDPDPAMTAAVFDRLNAGRQDGTTPWVGRAIIRRLLAELRMEAALPVTDKEFGDLAARVGFSHRGPTARLLVRSVVDAYRAALSGTHPDVPAPGRIGEPSAEEQVRMIGEAARGAVWPADPACRVCGCASHSCSADCDCCPEHRSDSALPVDGEEQK